MAGTRAKGTFDRTRGRTVARGYLNRRARRHTHLSTFADACAPERKRTRSGQHTLEPTQALARACGRER
eukprot:2113903-Pleurochrysis_carterae.AAC.1